MRLNESVMVTGSEGFLGTSLVRAIKNTGRKVIPVDYKLGQDLLKKESLGDLPDADVIVHLAGKTYIPSAWDDPHAMYDININTTLNMLEFARKRGARKFIFPSTYVYGQPQYLPIDEEHPVNVWNPYARSKLLGEELCRAYSEDYNIHSIILRLFNVYGPGQPQFFLIPTIISQLSSPTITLEDGSPRRDFVYVSDVIWAFQLSLDFNNSKYEIFNIGSGVSHRVGDIADLVLNISNSRGKVIYKNVRRKNEVMDTVADISKAKRLLGWEPKVTLGEGLTNMISNKI
jgi:UDP-glucose 4-epimerase